ERGDREAEWLAGNAAARDRLGAQERSRGVVTGALDDEVSAVIGANPDGCRVALRVDRDLRLERALAGDREVDGRLPHATRGWADGALDDGVGAVGAVPDRDRIALRVDRDLRPGRVLAGDRQVDGRLPH